MLTTKMFIKEEAPYCGRCWSNAYPGARKTTYTVYEGESENGRVLFRHEKDCTCSNCPLMMYSDGGPVRCPWCCCLPYLDTKDAQGNLLGKSKYVCDMCIFIPKYDLFDCKGDHIYRLRSEVCCCGMCVKCRCCEKNSGGGKGKCFRVPFLIREPTAPFNPIGDGAITDLWAGSFHECCNNREMYAIKFPPNMNPQDADAIKKTLIGMTLLLDITINEQDQ